ncbi:MAG: DUF262 domain-containing protein [Anaeromyxobacter sp.]
MEPEDNAPSAPAEGGPWNPDDIRITTKPYSLRHICDMISDGDLDLAPDFQRRDVWKAPQKARLIESILLRIPLPSFYFDEDVEGRLHVVDGVQRLTAIFEFARKSMKLSDLRYLESLDHKAYKELDPTLRRRFDGTQIFVNVIDPQTPPKVKFDVFVRLNTGGTPLNAQEIRHCISSNVSREFLKTCVSVAEFHAATGNAFRDKETTRMADRELALRFFALRQSDWEAVYRAKSSYDEFLVEMTQRIDGMNAQDLTPYVESFTQAMKNAALLFEGDAFRRWNRDGRKGPINKSLFESWAVVLADVNWPSVAQRKDKILVEFKRRIAHDEDYLASATVATTDLKRIQTRIRIAGEILDGSAP